MKYLQTFLILSITCCGSRVGSSSGSSLSLGQPCNSSSQCSPPLSDCLATDNTFQHWTCQCDANSFESYENHCSLKKPVTSTCSSDDECQPPLSCSKNKCEKIPCPDGQFWSSLAKKCVDDTPYARRGGGTRAAAGSGGRGGGTVYFDKNSRSWWTISWFPCRWPYIQDPLPEGATEDENDCDNPNTVAWEKIVVIFGGVVLTIFSCCWCSYKVRQMDTNYDPERRMRIHLMMHNKWPINTISGPPDYEAATRQLYKHQQVCLAHHDSQSSRGSYGLYPNDHRSSPKRTNC